MKVLAATKAGKIRAAVLILILVGLGYAMNLYALLPFAFYRPQDGDVVFQSLPHGPLVDAIEGVTQSPWSHCGVVMREGKQWQVVEAIGEVRRTPLYQWVLRGRHGQFSVYRPTATAKLPPQPQFRESLDMALRRYMGRPYDYNYAPGDSAIYCSELVFKAYRDAFAIELGSWDKLGDLNWKPHEEFIRTLELGKLPLDRPMITPVGVTRSPLLQLVFPSAH